MAKAGWLATYGGQNLDPSIRSQILLESSRSEARIAVFAILVAIGFGFFLGFAGDSFRTLVIYTLLVVIPLLIDSGIRRNYSSKLQPKL